jgi:hypothetical protein
VFRTAACLSGARAKADVDALAGDVYEGRGLGSPGNERAVDLVAARFDEAGLGAPPGGRLQRFTVPRWEPTATPSLAVGGLPLALGTDFEVVYESGSGTAAGPLVFAGYGVTIPPYDPAAWPACPFPASGYDDYGALDVAGAVVVVLRGHPAGEPDLSGCPPTPGLGCATAATCARTWRKVLHAARRGAAGVLLAPNDRELRDAAPFSSVIGEPLPTLLLSRDAAEAALPELAARAARIDATRAPAPQATSTGAALTVAGRVAELAGSNVLGVVPGTDLAGEVVVIGAHLDHMGRLPFREAYFPGADDNASGTAVLLELARAVAASPTRPRRTLLFAAWNGEELGLHGSCAYVEDDPRYPLASTVAAFSIDMVGAGVPGLELWGAVERPWMAAAAAAGAAALDLPWRPIAQPELTASDHACFLGAGVPGFLASTPTILEHPHYHTVGDVASTVPAANLEAAARTFWASVRGLAAGELTPPAEAARVSAASRAQARPAPSPAAPGAIGPGLVPGAGERP